MTTEFPSVMAYVSKLQPVNSVIDITLLVMVEFLTRCIFSSSSGRAMDSSSKQINLFTIQGAILMLSALILYTFHHTPYLLVFITTFILIRLLVLVFSRQNSDGVYSDSYISQPIRHSNWPGNNSLMQPASECKYPTSAQTAHLSAPTLVENKAAGFRQRSTAPVSNELLLQAQLNQNKERSKLLVGKNIQERYSSPLQRSPLPSSSMTSTTSDTQAGGTSSTSTSTRSFFGYNLGYFSSIFTNKQQSTIPSGMYNLGNTCFVNSTLQCLIWTTGFIDSLPYLYASQVYNDNTRLVRVLDDVVNLCHAFPDSGSDCPPVDSTKLLQSISLVAPHLVTTPGSDAYQSQQDAAEFLLWLLNHLHGILRVQSGGKSGLEFVLSDANISDLKKNKQLCLSTLQKSKSTNISSLREPLMNLSEVHWQLHWQEDSSTLYQLFLGQLIEARECQMCGKMSFSVEYFTMLPLPLPPNEQQCTLCDCFKHFSSTEEMTHSNMITCSCLRGNEITLTPGRRLTLLSHPSKRLVIQLTRYSYDSVNNMAVKDTVSVQFPTTLDLFPHTMSSVIGSNTNVQSMVYELQGFCVHSGAQSTSHGHYVSYCKVSTGNWYYFNDDRVSLVENIETELISTFVLQNAYLLFYCLKDC